MVLVHASQWPEIVLLVCHLTVPLQFSAPLWPKQPWVKATGMKKSKTEAQKGPIFRGLATPKTLLLRPPVKTKPMKMIEAWWPKAE